MYTSNIYTCTYMYTSNIYEYTNNELELDRVLRIYDPLM